MGKEDFKASLPFTLHGGLVVDVIGVVVRELVQAGLQPLFLWAEVHVVPMVPKAHESHGIVQRLRCRAQVGDDLAGASASVGLDINRYSIHVHKRKGKNVKRQT